MVYTPKTFFDNCKNKSFTEALYEDINRTNGLYWVNTIAMGSSLLIATDNPLFMTSIAGFGMSFAILEAFRVSTYEHEKELMDYEEKYGAINREFESSQLNLSEEIVGLKKDVNKIIPILCTDKKPKLNLNTGKGIDNIIRLYTKEEMEDYFPFKRNKNYLLNSTYSY